MNDHPWSANRPTRRSVLGLLGAAPLAGAEPFYAMNANRPMMAGSTMKLFTAGTAYERLGPDHHFRTRVYRTGPPAALSLQLTPHNRLAELVSPPLSEAVEPMLKLSSSPHTIHWPYVVGAVAGHEHNIPKARYEKMRSALFEQAGLDPYPPGADEGTPDFLVRYSPDFFVQFLTHMARQPYLPTYRQALPVMGRDGTLTNVQVDSPAAGHVHAKTGGVVSAMGPDGPATTYRALAGYIDLPDGRLTAFGAFTEQDVTRDEAGGLQDLARETLGEIATAVYEEASS